MAMNDVPLGTIWGALAKYSRVVAGWRRATGLDLVVISGTFRAAGDALEWCCAQPGQARHLCRRGSDPGRPAAGAAGANPPSDRPPARRHRLSSPQLFLLLSA